MNEKKRIPNTAREHMYCITSYLKLRSVFIISSSLALEIDAHMSLHAATI